VPDSKFECDFCVRIGLSKYTPKVDDDGQRLSNAEILERYNERRYQHYLDGFEDELDLARHLNDRTAHFAETASKDEEQLIKTAGFQANATTLAWWKRARERDPDAAAVAQKVDYEPTPAESNPWSRVSPAQRFARLKQQIHETFDGRHDVPPAPITSEDNAQQIPAERELSPAQQQALIEERDRQLRLIQEQLETEEASR
jgi:hypothetical protein